MTSAASIINAGILARLRQSIPITSTAYDDFLLGLILQAKDALCSAGAGINEDTPTENDQMLIVMYAKWLWDSNRTPGTPKPPALTLAINDRKTRYATGGYDDDG